MQPKHEFQIHRTNKEFKPLLIASGESCQLIMPPLPLHLPKTGFVSLRVVIWKKFQKLFPKYNKEHRLKRTQFTSKGGEKTSSQSKKYEKLDDDELYFITREDLSPEASEIAIDVNNAKDIPQQKRREEAEKPLYLMRYE